MVTMESGEDMDPCAFDKLFTRNVPHILEKIFFSLDYDSFKRCSDVNRTWRELHSSVLYERKSDEMLIEKKKDENKLCEASRMGNMEEVRGLLGSGMVDVNCVGELFSAHGYTPILLATINGHKDVVRFLLEKGANPSKAYKDGETPLHSSARCGRKYMVQLLLDGEADPNMADTEGTTPLQVAAYFGHKDVVELLMDRRADPNKANKDSVTPLHKATQWGDKDAIQLLLDGGADPTRVDNEGKMPVHVAARCDPKYVVGHWNDGEADMADTEEVALLQKAARYGRTGVVKLLLERGAKPNIESVAGQTQCCIQ